MKKYAPPQRYPQVGEVAWLKTNEEMGYEGVAYVQRDSSDHWTVIDPKDLSFHVHIYIGVDDEYYLLSEVMENVSTHHAHPDQLVMF